MGSSGEVDTIELPSELVARIDDRVIHTEFDDASAYVAHILEEVLYQAEETDLSTAEAVDEQQVKEQLESLGYLNE